MHPRIGVILGFMALSLGSSALAQGTFTNDTGATLRVGISSNDSGSGKIEIWGKPEAKAAEALLRTLDAPGTSYPLASQKSYRFIFVPAPGKAFLRRVEVGHDDLRGGAARKDVLQINVFRAGWGYDSLRVLRKFTNGLFYEPGPRKDTELDLRVRPAAAGDGEARLASSEWAQLVLSNASSRPLWLALRVTDVKAPKLLRIAPDDPFGESQSFDPQTEWPLAAGESSVLYLSRKLQGATRFILGSAPVGMLAPEDKTRMAELKVAVDGAPPLATLADVAYGPGDRSLLTVVMVALPGSGERPPKVTFTDR